MTDSLHSGDIDTSERGGGGRALGNRSRLSPVGVDVAVVVLVFGASVVNVASQDGV